MLELVFWNQCPGINSLCCVSAAVSGARDQ